MFFILGGLSSVLSIWLLLVFPVAFFAGFVFWVVFVVWLVCFGLFGCCCCMVLCLVVEVLMLGCCWTYVG